MAAVISPHLDKPVTNVTVNASTEVLATTDYGNVSKEGPFGNPVSPVKIAYVVGMHPWENYTHEAAVKTVKKLDKSLNYSYYIYYISVPGGIDADYDAGRMNGQVLAQEYVLPDIEKNSFQLVMDIHSNKGGEDFYEVKWFIDVAYPDEPTQKIADQLLIKIPGLTTYDPPLASSPEYFAIPLIQGGTPTIIYEGYAYDSPETMLATAERVLRAVDGLKFENNLTQLT